MTIPRATARLQLHAGFTLDNARAQVGYYARLGISHFYLSPVSRARPGSTHGYDVIDHSFVNPELGGEPALRALAQELRSHGMGIILDIVPNHMATHAGNPWWWDVLKYGRHSGYAEWLDIDWQSPRPELYGKILAPFLGSPYGTMLDSGELRLVFDSAAQNFMVDVCGTPYPIAPDTLQSSGLGVPDVLAMYDGREAQGRQRLHELLDRQHYKLCWWRCAAEAINWRRFFEVSELIGVRVERDEVFDAVHALPLRLFGEGWIDGLRIDHVDGLAAPGDYCRKLSSALKERAQQRAGALRNDEPWLVVEKILAHGEVLDADWKVHGTSGYDFMDQVGAVLHDPAGEAPLHTHWTQLSHDDRSPADIVRNARALMLERHFVAEREGVLQVLTRLAQASVHTRDWTREAIARVLDEILVNFPVYRTYANTSGRNAADAALMRRVLHDVRTRLVRDDRILTDLVDVIDIWLGASSIATAEDEDTAIRDLHREAIRRFQQLTPPLAAKSLEDTAFYRYSRLISRNEVGSEPAVFASASDDFHRRNAWRSEHAPTSLLATATHDHKRGEDVRARLAVLSEIPEEWARASGAWLAWPGNDGPPCGARQAAERYMLFQTLVGAWPLGLKADDAAGLQRFLDRVVQWQTKALREAKLSSSWFEPDHAYEQTSADYVYAMMPGAKLHGLLHDIERIATLVAPAGVVNSLAQAVLRTASPGIPDLYQGTEFWDFSLVDPDNRVAVDYASRQSALDAFTAGASMTSLLADWRSGRLKQGVVARCLAVRRERPNVFSAGDYADLPVIGVRAAKALAFARTHQGCSVMAIVPRHCHEGIRADEGGGLPLPSHEFWGDTSVELPRGFSGGELHDVLTGERHRCGPDARLPLAAVLAHLPVALLLAG
jgi:(1->4)-alpha-D-glucan 1-alpha-D-glucosylmutase